MQLRNNTKAGGHANAEIEVGVPYTVVDEWPWESIEKVVDLWPRKKIREHLALWAKEAGLIRNPNAKDIIGRLASNHFALQLARNAIDRTIGSPKVGKRCAFVVEQESYKNIRQCMIDLDVAPQRLSPADASKSPHENRQSQFDFRPKLAHENEQESDSA